MKYFFDISELQAQGKSISDVTASLIYDRGATEFGQPSSIASPKLCPKSSSTYYVEMGFAGYDFWGLAAARHSAQKGATGPGLGALAHLRHSVLGHDSASAAFHLFQR